MRPKDLFDIFDKVRKLISDTFFQGGEPIWLAPLGNHVLIAIFVVLATWGLLFALSQIKKIWIEHFLPFFYDAEKKHRVVTRQRFAEHTEHEISKLNRQEEWKTYRFAELEAEVEVEGRRKGVNLLPFLQTTQRGLRREKSLSKALEASRERLILLEGEPGSGKSVALKYLTSRLAQRAMKSETIKSLIPLYINLKKLERTSQEKIDRNLIEKFVIRELNQVNDRDIAVFLDKELPEGIRQGTWLFLFDSFDELPEVLSSTDADETARLYSEAIGNFLSGFNRCRGIIASRQFRGPKHLSWPRFRILPLEDRRSELIRKAALPLKIEKLLIRQLRTASQEIQGMTKNPMFLSILCENMRDTEVFPQNAHSAFESYLEKRLTRDEERLKKRFNLGASEVRLAAERVAFCMLLDSNLGLNPTRKGISDAMARSGFRVPGNFDSLLDALEFIKLARSDSEMVAGISKTFTFSHRRFQEYFATCIVLKESGRISPRKLLTDGRWRETTVVIFQTQPPEAFAPILTEAKSILSEIIARSSGLIDDPIGYVNQATRENHPAPEEFQWHSGTLHLLGLLQDGFSNRIGDLWEDIQIQAGRLLLSACVKGNILDRKCSLEVAGITPQPVLLWLLRDTFSSESQWLKEVAYRQVAQLRRIPEDISSDIFKTILNLFISRRLYKERFATYAHLSRLENHNKYLNALRLLQYFKPIENFVYFGIIFSLLFICIYMNEINYLILVFLLLTSFLISRVIYAELYSVLSPKNKYSRDRASIFYGFSLFIFLCFSRSIILPLILILPIGFMKTIIFHHRVLITLFSIFFIQGIWSFFAMIASGTGQFTHPIWWIPLIFFPFLYFLRNSRKTIKMIILAIENRKSTIIISFVFYLLFFPGLHFLSTLIGMDLSVTLKIVSSISLLAFGVILWVKYIELKDRIRFWRWVKSCPDSVSMYEILNLFLVCNSQNICKKILIACREKNLLLVHRDSQELLKGFITDIESGSIVKTGRRE
jgi:hypothetical protein